MHDLYLALLFILHKCTVNVIIYNSVIDGLTDMCVIAGSLEVVKQMVDQVLRLHPHTKWFHIGADEVNNTIPACSTQKTY